MTFDDAHLAVALLLVGAFAGELVHVMVITGVVHIRMKQGFFYDRVAAPLPCSFTPLGFVVLLQVSRPERGGLGVPAVYVAVELKRVRRLRDDAVRPDLFHDVLIGPVQTSGAFRPRHVTPIEVAVAVGVAERPPLTLHHHIDFFEQIAVARYSQGGEHAGQLQVEGAISPGRGRSRRGAPSCRCWSLNGSWWCL